MRARIFTAEEADRMTPLLRRIVVSLRAHHRLIERRRAELVRAGPEAEAPPDLLALRAGFQRCIGELEALGCFVRDPAAGVVACYGELEGRIVYLTYEPGDPGFSRWHPLDKSYLDRQPIAGRLLVR
jgi:hypothetical protein